MNIEAWREKAMVKLEEMVPDAITRIQIAQECGAQAWYQKCIDSITRRSDALRLEEARSLGWQVAATIAKARTKSRLLAMIHIYCTPGHKCSVLPTTGFLTATDGAVSDAVKKLLFTTFQGAIN